MADDGEVIGTYIKTYQGRTELWGITKGGERVPIDKDIDELVDVKLRPKEKE